MWKKRIWALVIIIIGAGLAVWIWAGQTGKKPFSLGLDLSGGSYVVFRADTSKVPAGAEKEALESLRNVIERRVNLFGVSEPQVSLEDTRLSGEGVEHRLVVELPGITDVQKATEMIGETPLLEFRTEDPDYSKTLEDIQSGKRSIEITQEQLANGQLDLASMLPSEYLPTQLTGQYLSRATLQFDQTTGKPVVSLEFDAEGSKLFEELTRANIGKTIAIYLDGSPISTPRVDEAISGGKAVISGTFESNEAKELVERLNSGALPVPIQLIETNTIGPTLGADALHAGVMAGIIGLIAICALLIIWYRVPGVIASVNLILYGIVMLFIMQRFPIVLTSAGIAGFIISLGMAVDANILLSERLKEELNEGKNVREAISSAWTRAWTSIRDGNSSSIITAFLLYIIGTTLIKGFAVTFGLGVIVSLLVAVIVSRLLLLAVSPAKLGRVGRFFFSSGFHTK